MWGLLNFFLQMYMFRMAVQSQLWSGLQLKDMMDRIEEGTKLDIGPSNKQVAAQTVLWIR